MDLATLNIGGKEAEQLLEAQAHIWRNTFNFMSSMALKCAVQLEIPDTIHKHGSPMSLNELAKCLPIHPNKVSALGRIMRLLVSSNFFSKTPHSSPDKEEEEEAFALTLSSQLLLKDHPLTQAPFLLTILDQCLTSPSHHLCSWLQIDEKSPFEVAYGRNFWEHASHEPKFNESFNRAMESDSRLVTSVLVSNDTFKGIVQGIESLVDVGGGNGTTIKAIVEAFPWLKCIVFDLPHVVQGLQDKNQSKFTFVVGDMFVSVPPADAILLKCILHDWSDHACIKILQQCKEALHEGGKVIIIDMVVEPLKIDGNLTCSSAQLLCDMEMMSLNEGGKERTIEEWRKIFINSGFSDFKIFPILGVRSLIIALCGPIPIKNSSFILVRNKN